MQRKMIIGLVLTLVIAVFIPLYWVMEPGRQEAARERQKAETMQRGAELYTSTCGICHGPTGEGNIGPALRGIQLDDNSLGKIISSGIPGTSMPAWSAEEGGPLKKHQIEDLVIFIKNWDSSLLQTSASTPMPTPAPSPTAAGELYASNCASCHGPQGEGTAIGPMIAGHSASAVKLQVRNPVGTMPAFSEAQLSKADLDKIADFIAGLEEAKEPVQEWEKAAPETIHHWMALLAIKSGDLTDARHHIEDALTFIEEPAQKVEMQKVLELIDQGRLHDAEHEIEQMAGAESPSGVTIQRFHLIIASRGVEERDFATIKHHLEHFLLVATDGQKVIALEAIELAEEGDFHEAEHEIEELLEAYPAPAQSPSETPEQTTSLIDAYELFASKCSACHGTNRQGIPGLAPALTPEGLAALSDDQIRDTILNGRLNTAMASYKGTLTPEEIDALLQFIKHTSP